MTCLRVMAQRKHWARLSLRPFIFVVLWHDRPATALSRLLCKLQSGKRKSYARSLASLLGKVALGLRGQMRRLLIGRNETRSD